MTHSRESVLALVQTSFPACDQIAILAMLDEYGAKPFHNERHRVHMAIINLCAADSSKLREYVDVALNDYRDVLYWSEYPQDARLDTAEQRAQLLASLKPYLAQKP